MPRLLPHVGQLYKLSKVANIFDEAHWCGGKLNQQDLQWPKSSLSDINPSYVEVYPEKSENKVFDAKQLGRIMIVLYSLLKVTALKNADLFSSNLYWASISPSY